MKKFFFLLILATVSIASHAQVGISTNIGFVPTTTLDVDGTSRLRDTVKLDYVTPSSGTRWLIIDSTGKVDTVSAAPTGPTGLTGAQGPAGTPATPNTADNGLTITSNNIQLGGTLLQTTTIPQGGFNFQFTGAGSVGIGNLSGGGTPSHKLHVGGGVRVEDGFLANDGTVGLPAYRFNGDVDNGMYRAATNSIGLVTGGSERIRILSTGFVGIGTTTPSERLDVSGNVKLTATTTATTTNGQLQFTAGGEGVATKMVVFRKTTTLTTANTLATKVFDDGYMRFGIWFNSVSGRWVIGFSPYNNQFYDYNYLGNARYYNGTYRYTNDGLNNYVWSLSDDVTTTSGTYYECGGVLNTASWNYATGGSGMLYAEGTTTTNPFYEYSFFVSYTSTSTQRVVTVIIKAYY